MRKDTLNSHAPDTSGTTVLVLILENLSTYRPIGKTLLISFELHNKNANEKISEKMSLSIFLLSWVVFCLGFFSG